MSFDGFRSSNVPNRDGGNTADDRSMRTPQRDAWNRPIVEPKVKSKEPDSNDALVDDDAIDNIWSDIQKKSNDQQQQQPNNQQLQQQPPPQQPDANAQLKKYLTDNGLGELTLSDAEKNEIKEGNFDNFNQKVLGLVQQAHIKALSGAQTLIKAEVAKAIKEGGEQTRNFIAGKEAVTALNNALPWTKDSSIGPIAQTVMQRLIDRGASVEQSIQGVKAWSKKFVSLADPDRQVNGNRSGNFRGQPSDEESTNWVDLLSPKG